MITKMVSQHLSPPPTSSFEMVTYLFGEDSDSVTFGFGLRTASACRILRRLTIYVTHDRDSVEVGTVNYIFGSLT